MPLHLLDIAESTTTSGSMEAAYISESLGLLQQHISHTNLDLGLKFSYLFFDLKTYSPNESLPTHCRIITHTH